MFVAKDKYGGLSLFNECPKQKDGFWICDNEQERRFGFPIKDSSLFPNLKLEDEPQEVTLCLNNEKYHTVKLEELNRLYEIDWKYQDMKETLESYQCMIDNYRLLPWYKRIFTKI